MKRVMSRTDFVLPEIDASLKSTDSIRITKYFQSTPPTSVTKHVS